MIEFKSFQSKPIERQAFQITAEHEWAKVGDATYIIAEKTEETQALVRFKAYEEPGIGDWIVRLTEADTYHCTDAVFRERNIVPD